MPRNQLPRTILNKPKAVFYKPHGVCLRDLEIVELNDDEFEAMKLHDFDQLSQIDAAQSMSISQPTFGRIINRAYRKVSMALFEGKAIAIQIPEKQDKRNTVNKDTVCDVCGSQCLSND